MAGGDCTEPERVAFDQFEDQPTYVVSGFPGPSGVEGSRTRDRRLLEAIDGGNVRMIERGEHPRFALETREPI